MLTFFFSSCFKQVEVRKEVETRLEKVQNNLATGLKKENITVREAVKLETADGSVGVYVSKAPEKIADEEEEKEETINLKNSKTKIVIPPIKTDKPQVAKVMHM